MHLGETNKFPTCCLKSLCILKYVFKFQIFKFQTPFCFYPILVSVVVFFIHFIRKKVNIIRTPLRFEKPYWKQNTMSLQGHYSSKFPALFIIGHIWLSGSTVNHTHELSGINHVTLFRKYGKHSTGSITYGPWARTYRKLFSCKSVLMVCSYRAQSNEMCMHERVSRGSLPWVRR